MIALPQASTAAPLVDAVATCLLVISVALVSAVWILLIWFCWKYRASRAADRRNPPQKPTRLELAVCGTIFAFGLATFVVSAKYFHFMVQAPPDALEVDVIAKRWMWVFHDARAGDQINSFKVPLGRPVRLVMTSEDVIHSLFIPAFRIKQDVLPGRYTSLWFEATQLGRFEILCTQYCGMDHSEMRAAVEVVTPEEYASSGGPRLSDNGSKIFVEKACASCHEGERPIGPSLKGLFGRRVQLRGGRVAEADENYLRRSILEPNAEVVAGYPAVMPTFQGQLSEPQLRDLVNYIKSLE